MKKEEKKPNKKGQAWSIDIVIGVILFLVIIVVVYTLVATSPLGNMELRRDAEIINAKLDRTRTTDPNIPSLFSGNMILAQNIEDLLNEDYEELRLKLGIKGDFCIVITYMHGGIYNLSPTHTSYGNPADTIKIGRTGSDYIFCGS